MQCAETNERARGFIHVARKPCGKLAAMCWESDDDFHVKYVENYRQRGFTVERLEVFPGDSPSSLGDWCCWPGDPDCMCQNL